MLPITDNEIAEVLFHEKYTENREKYMARMVVEGYQIMTPEPNELLLDLDTEEDYAFFQKASDRLREEYPNQVVAGTWPSKSGLPHRHALVILPFPVDAGLRIAFQAALGSDRTRELLSLFRSQAGDPLPTLLAEKK